MEIFGGAVYLSYVDNSIISNTTFVNNNATSGSGGGACLFYGTNVSITNTTFKNNKANECGGGAYFYSSSNASITNTTFTNNTAEYYDGGGAYLRNSDNASIINTKFDKNTAFNGGGAYLDSSDNVTIKNCLFDNENNLYSSSSSAKSLNETTPIPGTNIAGGPYLGGNAWLQDPEQNISEWGTDANSDGICDEPLTINNSNDNSTFGTDEYPLVYGGTTVIQSAKTWNVSFHAGGDNVTNVSNISSQINDNDIIRIWGEEGHTYEGGFTINASNVLIIQWEGSPELPIITNTSQTAPAITVTADNVTLKGLNISGNFNVFHYGAGIYANGSSDSHLQGFNINECVFTENTADYYGGAVYLAYVDNSRIKNTNFKNNNAGNGGGAYFYYSSNASIMNTIFKNNTVTNYGGGAYFYYSSNASITNTTFKNNTAKSNHGGGAYFEYSSNASIMNTIFTNNTAKYGGGAYFYYSSNAVIKNCLFDNENNLHSSYSPAKSLNETTPILGTNIAGGPYLGGNIWLRDSSQNISEWGTDTKYDGICDQNLTISGFGTDEYPLVYGSTANITSVPSSAFIYIDGENTTNTTNASIYLPVGNHTFSLHKKTFSTWEKTVNVVFDKQINVEATLTDLKVSAPTLNLSATEGFAPLAVDVNVSVNITGGEKPDSWNLSLGNGTWINKTSSDEINGTVTYDQAGEYTLKLNVSANGVSNESSKKIKVKMPTPKLNISQEEGLAPLSVTINVSGEGKPEEWNLSIGDGRWINGTSSDSINSTVKYEQAGEYTLTLNVSANGESNESSKKIKVNTPAPTLSVSSEEGFAPLSINVNVSGEGKPEEWNLSIGDGRWINGTSSNSINSTVKYEQAGEYTLKLNVSANGESNESSKKIKVKMPTPTMSVSNNEGLAPLSVDVNVSGKGEPEEWNLSLGDGRWINGTNSDEINGTICYEQAGEYTLNLNVSAKGVFNESSKKIKVEMPAPTLNISTKEGFAPLSINVNATGEGKPEKWNLSLGNGKWINGTSSDQINRTVTYEQAGEYTLNLNVSAKGVFNESSKKIKVEMPAPTLNISTKEGFAPLSTNVNVTGEGEPQEWNLSLGNGTWINGTSSDEINRTIRYEAAGEYTLNLKVYANGLFNESSKKIKVKMPAPTISLSKIEGLVPLSVDINVSGAGEPEEWNLSIGNGTWINGTSSDEINRTVTYEQVGEYTLKLNVSRNGFSNFTAMEVKALAQSSSSTTHSSSTRTVSQGSHVSYQISDSAIYMVSLTTGETTHYFSFTVEDKALPSGMTPPSEAAAVYEYSEVSHSQVSNTSFTEVTLNFSVPKTWLEENGFTAENVVLYYHTDTWQALETEVLGEDEENVRFSAQSPGFSLFAIGVKASEEPSNLSTTTTRETEAESTTEETENTEQESPIWYGEAVLAIGAAYILKKKSL